MLNSTLFSKFPAITYNDVVATNITIRLKMDRMVEEKLLVFYPYTVTEGERADVIAHRYYKDANYAWLIYLANGISNPLEEWHKTTEQLNKLIVSKYGSIAAAYKKIVFFRVEWASDDSMLDPAAFRALTPIRKKYWVPVVNPNSGDVMYYQRAQVEWVTETNKIITLSVASPAAAVSVGDIIVQMTQGVPSASGEVSLVDDASGNLVIHIKHISGEFISNKTVYLEESGVAVGSALSVSVVATPLQDEEQVYWSPVTAYDYEVELNESKKHIRLIDSAYLDIVEQDIRRAMAP